MKMIKTFAFLAFLICGISVSSSAQSDYSTAVGLRAAWGVAISGKKFINDDAALEGILHYRRYGYFSSYNFNRITIMALYQKHGWLYDVIPGLAYYYGGGGFVGFYSGDSYWSDRNDGNANIGLALNLGLDYKFEDFPINISADWIPAFSFTGYRSGFSGEVGGVAIRYTF